MTESSRVEVDTRELDAGIRQLAAGLDAAGPRVGGATAQTIAGRLRPMVPVRSGRLRSTVVVDKVEGGAQVHYGGGLPYAGYIDGRTDATARALSGAPAMFHVAMHGAAASEIRRL